MAVFFKDHVDDLVTHILTPNLRISGTLEHIIDILMENRKSCTVVYPRGH